MAGGSTNRVKKRDKQAVVIKKMIKRSTVGETSFVTSTGQQSSQLGFPVNDGVDAIVNLDDLGDVTVTTPSTGDILEYNGTEFVNVENTALDQAQVLIRTLGA